MIMNLLLVKKMVIKSNKKLNKKIETIFLMSEIENEIISSKFIKEIAKLKGDLKKFLTKSTINAVKLKFR